MMDKFECKSDLVCTFETDELTALCPFDFGGPDYYTATIRYETDSYTVESKSLKQYLQSYRDIEISAEELAHRIYDDISVIEPKRLYIRLEQARRGGIEETVEVGDNELSA